MDELARLKWQCRRGTKELDTLLERYLSTSYLTADPAEKALFKELLMLEDDQLMAVLTGSLSADKQKYSIFSLINHCCKVCS